MIKAAVVLIGVVTAPCVCAGPFPVDQRVDVQELRRMAFFERVIIGNEAAYGDSHLPLKRGTVRRDQPIRDRLFMPVVCSAAVGANRDFGLCHGLARHLRDHGSEMLPGDRERAIELPYSTSDFVRRCRPRIPLQSDNFQLSGSDNLDPTDVHLHVGPQFSAASFVYRALGPNADNQSASRQERGSGRENDTRPDGLKLPFGGRCGSFGGACSALLGAQIGGLVLIALLFTLALVSGVIVGLDNDYRKWRAVGYASGGLSLFGLIWLGLFLSEYLAAR